jgi:hypothetical protein
MDERAPHRRYFHLEDPLWTKDEEHFPKLKGRGLILWTK